MDVLGKSEVRYIIVHHTQRTKDFPAYVKLRHVRVRGWEHIGYHFLIGRGRPFTREGKLYMGRPERYVGAHALGYNHRSIGVCLIGDLDKRKPTKRQMDSLFSVLRDKMREYGVPVENVLGHRELPGVAKSCPGKNLDMDFVRAVLAGKSVPVMLRRIGK
ncbi:MAG: peptidoglycan recognition family protein [archaeon]